MKTKNDVLISGDIESRTVWVDGERLDPADSQKIFNHSPDGFNWGYAGSGPAQLALAILLHCGASFPLDSYQEFKNVHVATWPQDDFEVKINIREWI